MTVYSNREFLLKSDLLKDLVKIHELAQRPPQSITYQSNNYTQGQKKAGLASNHKKFLIFNK